MRGTLVALTVAVGMVVGGGCALKSRTDLSPARTTITTEDRQPVVAHETRTIRHSDGRTETVMRTENAGPTSSATATAQGAGIASSGHEIQQGFDAAPPEINLRGVTSSGGGIRARARLRGEVFAVVGRAAGNPLFWVGVLLLLGGIACFVVPVPLRRAGAILVASAAGTIACSFLPAWAWWIIAALTLGLGAVYLAIELGLLKHKNAESRVRLAAAGIVRSVERLPPEVRAQVKERVDLATDEDDKAVIRDLKRGV